MKAKEIIEKLESLKTPRSAWRKGVLHYAFFIMSKFDRETEIESETTLLRGAKDWWQASCSGRFYVNDEVIALTLCNNSELRMTRDGKRKPSRYETWLDVQARALFQASKLILSIMKNPQKTLKNLKN